MSSIEMRIVPQKTVKITSLGKTIRIGKKSKVTVEEPGVTLEYFSNSVSILIGIGNDHTAHLIMSEEAFEALNSDQEVVIETIQEHIKSTKNGRKK